MSRRSPRTLGILAAPHLGAYVRSVFVVGSLLLALPLAALSVVPAPAFAHPATSAHAVAPSIGKISSSTGVNLTLHYSSPMTDLNDPNRMGMDAAGNLYVSDLGLDQVAMFHPDDTFSGITYGIGTVGVGNGYLNRPEGVVVSGGVVYVADYGNALVQTFNQNTGAFISEFGKSDLIYPIGMALGSNGTLYVVDSGTSSTGNNRIDEFSTGGTFLGSFGSYGSGTGQFSGPGGIAFNPTNGNLYVTDNGNHRVQEFTLGGTYVTQWGAASFSDPTGIAADRAGMVYVMDTTANTVYKFDPNGNLVGSYAAPTTTPVVVPGTFVAPVDVAVRSTPNTPLAVYVSDPGTGIGTGFVQRFDEVLDPYMHNYQAQWGTPGSGTGQFNAPQAAVVDNAGNVYVTDSGNSRVQKFDQFGHFVLAFGSSGGGNGQFNSPTGIALSPDGATVYVVDELNNRVQEFSPSGTYLGQFGNGPGSGKGQFFHPYAIVSDGKYLYVTDSANYRVQVFDTSGNYQYEFGTIGTGPGQFEFPTGIALDQNRQELFIADASNNRVDAYLTGGTYIASATGAASVNFNYPEQVSTDQRGDVYVGDTLNGRIVEFDVNLTRFTEFGSIGNGNGQFSSPTDAVVSPTNGQIYVTDYYNTRIQRLGSPWPKNDTVGIYRPSAKTFYLRNENTTGPADISVYMPYAQTGDLPIVGDWNGDGVDTVGLYRPSTARFLLQDANVQESSPDYTFTLGIAGDTPIAGDWNGDGSDGAGIFRPSNGILYLRNTLSTGVADYNLVLGVPGDIGIAGDWNGDGQDSPGVYRPSNQRFYVSNKVTNGVVTSDHSAILGISGDVPFTGDWMALGASGIGVFRPSNGVTYEKNTIVTGPADANFIYGIAGDVPVAGQWVEPTAVFSSPAPHVSLGIRVPAPHPASHTPTPGHTASSGQPLAAMPRRSIPR